MVLDDRLIEGMDAAAIETVMRPKVRGALNLEQAVAGLRLDYLLFYSSATTLFGNPGQFNYVAANGFVEGLARRACRRAESRRSRSPGAASRMRASCRATSPPISTSRSGSPRA